MSIGISTASFYPLETEEALRLICENDIACAEVFYNAERELKSSFTDYLLDITRQSNLKISALHPMFSNGEPFLLFSEYYRRFEDSVDSFKKYFEAAEALGARFITLHGDRQTGKLSVEEYCERFYILADIAKSYNVILCQENVNAYRSADPEFLMDMVRILKDDVNFTLDIKQCIRAGYTVDQIASAMGDKIRHIHISDHSLGGDCLLPFKGNFDFKTFFNDMKNKGYTGDYIIEVYRNAYSDYSEIFESYKQITQL